MEANFGQPKIPQIETVEQLQQLIEILINQEIKADVSWLNTKSVNEISFILVDGPTDLDYQAETNHLVEILKEQNFIKQNGYHITTTNQLMAPTLITVTKLDRKDNS